MFKKGNTWFFLVICLLATSGMAQGLPELRHCTTPTYKMDFYILLADKKINYKDTLSYHWFKSQRIYETQGSSAGYLLHGSFVKYDLGGQLAEKGQFKFGLRHGEWRSWYPSGHIRSVCYYKHGLLHGKMQVFDEEGKLTEAIKYKKGRAKISRRAPVTNPEVKNTDTDTTGTREGEKWFKFRKRGEETNAAEGQDEKPKREWRFGKKSNQDDAESQRNEADEPGWFKRLFKQKNEEMDPAQKKEEKRVEKEKKRAAKKAEKESKE